MTSSILATPTAKAITGITGASTWGVLASANEALQPIGGQYTIVGCLLVAIGYLVKELKQERVRNEEYRSDMIQLMQTFLDEKKSECKEAWHRVDNAEKHNCSNVSLDNGK